jgi:hypothetical protein
MKDAVHTRQRRHRIRQFVKTSFEPVKNYHPETDQNALPVSLNKPATLEEPAKRRLPLFMEQPLFKAKEFDPL